VPLAFRGERDASRTVLHPMAILTDSCGMSILSCDGRYTPNALGACLLAALEAARAGSGAPIQDRKGQATMAIINGTNDPDILTGTGGDDTITGLRGNDVARMGFGNDRFVWNPGDGNDTVDGQAGTDTLAFNGANIGEAFNLSANGTHAQLFRNIADITMDLQSVERIELRTLGGADTISVNDLSATAVKQVAIDLGAFGGGGDTEADTVVVNGNNGNHSIHVAASGGQVSVTGLHETVTLTNAEADDALVVNGLGGNDVLDAAGLSAAALRLTLDGGAGNDTITGGQGDDTLRGGEGNDTVTGGHGSDTAFLGDGNDVFTWNAGDGNDTVEGEAGTDAVHFNGSNAAENIQVFANGGRVGLTDNVDTVTLDINGVERLGIHTLGGADNVFIGDLTGTGLGAVTVDLAHELGRTNADAATDTVIVTGTSVADAVKIASSGSDVVVTGLSAEVTVSHASTNDLLTINTLGGDDVIDASQLGAGRLNLTINGGAGNDTITGSAGNDVINGGQGSDVALMGAGNDRFVWNPGDGSDKVNGQTGFDTLEFNGANINEQIDISAIGTHAQFFRNVAAINMDLESVERIEFRALGGADTITINDLTGTAVKEVAIDLGAVGGTGDGAADTVVVNFGKAADSIHVTQGADGTISVANENETISIAHADTGDHLFVNALDGNDTLDASTLKAGAIAVTLDGGGGNDLIFGGAGADTLLGGEGNDTVTWSIGGGSDVIDGQGGLDTLALLGGIGDDTLQVFANGAKLGISASDGSVLDVSGMEQVRIDAKDGADTIVLGDLRSTDVDQVTIDLGISKGSSTGDGKVDTVTINASLAEVMSIATEGNHTVITHESTLQSVILDHVEATDILKIQGSLGNDVIQASTLAGMSLQINAGAGADAIFSGSGDDVISGGQGSDVALMGAGNDRFVWNPGDGSDTVDGQTGTDTLEFHGANIAEEINILADGKHAEMTRNVAAIDMHLDNVERIEFSALGGVDNIHVHDMNGTAVKQVAIDLGSNAGTGDGAVDTVTVDGTGGNDHVTVSSANGTVTMTGLPAEVTITHGELDDGIVVNGGGGNDTIDASGLQSDASRLTLDGGAGNDTLTGGENGDLIFGGDGHDLLKGGAGVDTIDGGIGDDTITGGLGDDILTGGEGADTFNYTGALDGHDLITGFTAGQDKLDLTQLFDGLGVSAGDRDGRVSIIDHGNGSFDVAVDADGNKANGFELAVATVQATSPIAVGHEVITHG
jgi:Ca2+-binding RTX toxin-like protein